MCVEVVSPTKSRHVSMLCALSRPQALMAVGSNQVLSHHFRNVISNFKIGVEMQKS